MSGTWISQIQSALCKQFPATKDYKAADFKQSPMPVSVGHFLEHALSRRAATIQVSVDGDWFDTTQPDVRDAERQWREVLTAAARYPSSLWEQSLNQALSLVVSFMVEPGDSFCEFAFAGNERGVQPRTLLNRLAYFKPYPGLREVIRGYIEKKSGEPIEPADLRAAIIKADRSMVAGYKPSDWIALLTPLYEIAEVNRVGTEDAVVPMSMLKRLFEAKGADEVVQRLEAIESIGGHRMLSEVGLLKALGPTEVEKPVEEPETPPAARPETPKPPAGPVQRNDQHAGATDTAMPRWMQFASKVEPKRPSGESGDGGAAIAEPQRSVAPAPRAAVEPPSPVIPEAQTPPNMQPSPAIDQTIPSPSRVGERAPMPDDPVESYSRPDATARINQPAPAAPVPQVPPAAPVSRQETFFTQNPVEHRVFGSISPQQRSAFVENLFLGSYADFSRVVSMLDKAGDWQSAAHVIGSEVFERNDVDIYSDAAIEFTNIVEARFQ